MLFSQREIYIAERRISQRDCSPVLPEMLTQKSMKSVTPSHQFPRRLGLLRRTRTDDAFHTRKTDCEPIKRSRLSRYPNRCVANSTSLSDRCQLRPRHVGNPSTNDACLVRNDIKFFGHWHASSKLDASMLPMACWMTSEQPYFVGAVNLQLSNKNVRIN